MAAIAKIAYAGTSHVLIAASDPTEKASTKMLNKNAFLLGLCFALSTMFKDRPIVNIANGIDIKWACRSAKRKVQNGNSVILI